MSSKLIIPQTTGEPDYGYFGKLNAPQVITVPDAQKKAMLEKQTLKDIWDRATPEQKLLAAKNLGKLAVNFGMDFIPGVGDFKSAQEAITGTQPMLEGVPGVESKLTMPERIGAAVGALPFVPNMAGALWKVVKSWDGKYLINESRNKFAESPVGKSFPDQVPAEDVWYHGTQSDFQEIKSKGIKRGTSDIISRLGVHFAENEYVSEKFAKGLYGDESKGGKVIHAKLKISNPKKYSMETDLRDDMGQYAIDSGLVKRESLKGLEAETGKVGYSEGSDIIQKLKGHDRVKLINGFNKYLQDQGFDGIIYGNGVEGYFGNKAAIVFDPKQIEVISTTSKDPKLVLPKEIKPKE